MSQQDEPKAAAAGSALEELSERLTRIQGLLEALDESLGETVRTFDEALSALRSDIGEVTTATAAVQSEIASAIREREAAEAQEREAAEAKAKEREAAEAKEREAAEAAEAPVPAEPEPAEPEPVPAQPVSGRDRLDEILENEFAPYLDRTSVGVGATGSSSLPPPPTRDAASDKIVGQGPAEGDDDFFVSGDRGR